MSIIQGSINPSLQFNNKSVNIWKIPKIIMKLKKKYSKNLNILNNCNFCYKEKTKDFNIHFDTITEYQNYRAKNVIYIHEGSNIIDVQSHLNEASKTAKDIKNGLIFKTCTKHIKNQQKLEDLNYLIIWYEKLLNKFDVNKNS